MAGAATISPGIKEYGHDLRPGAHQFHTSGIAGMRKTLTPYRKGQMRAARETLSLRSLKVRLALAGAVLILVSVALTVIFVLREVRRSSEQIVLDSQEDDARRIAGDGVAAAGRPAARLAQRRHASDAGHPR